jgi:16S rRNA (guanine527-N7)-methyltransferase
MDHIQSDFLTLLHNKGIQLSEVQIRQFELYYQELVEWNGKVNLTAITEKEGVYIKHFYDSLSLSFFVNISQISTLADIGSGAGFPSIPLKIVYPHLKVTIIDSLQKRITFLQHLVQALGLEGVTCIHGRAEDIARLKEHRDHYDLVTARAVARLSVLSEFCLPFVKPNGQFLAMKGSEVTDELQKAAYSFKELKGQLIEDNQFKLPNDHGIRHLIEIQKKSITPGKYPRKAGTPLKIPLEL